MERNQQLKTYCPSVHRVEMKFYQRVGWDFIEVICLKRHISQFNQVYTLSIINR